ncbi:DUF3667 domain-containing protein [Brevundimonas sp. UBA7664]|uniref:DUF3667 domain-containing protein n=1 Tax=Brevundimonas sp. UBA7664 TaxID=1946141 RepID=UPI0025B84D0C|nr:DUF3667 domain-containing protein [Brevundimonas sp. UBA7664]
MATHPEPPSACPACGLDLVGRYCHGCGQDTLARPRPLRDMAAEALSETTLIDSRLVRTVGALAARPARLLEAYRSGAGGLYVSPIKIFVVMTALFLAVLNFSDVVIFQYVREVVPGQAVVATPDPDGATVHVAGATERDHWMQQRVTPFIDPRVTTAIEAALARAETPKDRANLSYELQADREQAVITERMGAWLPNALWLLMPLFALLLMPLFGRRRLFMEHLVFAMWAHSMAFGLLILLALINRFGADAPAWPLLGPYLAYLVMSARAYYGLPLASAAWRGAAHTVLYFALVLLPAALVVAISAMDVDAFLAFMAA